jgi:hypothetical protein
MICPTLGIPIDSISSDFALERHTGRWPGRTDARSCLCCLLSMPAIARSGPAGHVRRHLQRDGALPDGRLRRASIRDQQGGASRRMVVRQRLGLHRPGHAGHRNGPWASSFVSRQSARRNPTIPRRHSSKPSNALCSAIDPDAETVIALLPACFEDYNRASQRPSVYVVEGNRFC